MPGPPWTFTTAYAAVRKSDGFAAKAPNTRGKGIAIFNQCGYILETVIDTGTFTVEDEYKFVCVLYRIVPLSMTLSDREPQFQGHSIV